MNEQLNLAEFDILGIIKLRDVSGIEKYVTPIIDENTGSISSYFSRSKEYYNVKSLTELSQEREQLKAKLTREKNKRNFVILENMLNCSAKSYFKKLEEYIKNPRDFSILRDLVFSRRCLLEDTKNIIVILSNEGMISCDPRLILPEGQENCPKRAIEMDNKAMLYLFIKNIELEGNPKDIQILTPGYGSIYIGPFFYIIHKYGFTNLLKSKYINETSGLTPKTQLEELVSNNEIFKKGKKIVLIDDNIGTGTTMDEIKELLAERGLSCYKCGAIQYNWRNYFKISIGEKTNIDRFNVNSFQILSPLNYAGHNLYSHAIDMLHSSGSEYEKYLKSKSYRIDMLSDIWGAVKRTIICAKKTGLDISRKEDLDIQIDDEQPYTILPRYEDDERIISEDSYTFIDRLIEEIQALQMVPDIETKKKEL